MSDVCIGAVRRKFQRPYRRSLGCADLASAVIRGVHVDFPQMGIGEAQERADIVVQP